MVEPQTTQVVGSCFGFLEWYRLLVYSLFVVLLLARAANGQINQTDFGLLYPPSHARGPLPPAAAHFFA